MGLFLEKIRQKIGDNLNGLKKSRPVAGKIKSLAEVKNVLVLCDINHIEQVAGIGIFKSELKKICPSANIFSIVFKSKQITDATLISDNHIEYVSEQDFNFFFKIKNKTVKDYLTGEYDMTVWLSTKNEPYVDYMSKYLNGRLKIGKKNVSENVSNFMIDTETMIISDLSKMIIDNLKMIFNNK